MTEQIADKIKQRVWIRYVKGDSPTKIRKHLGISRTSYYGIIDDVKSKDPDLPLMRTLAVSLKKNGLDAKKYAKCLRISNLLEQFSVQPTTGERLLGGLLVACHQQNWKPYQAVKALSNSLILQKFLDIHYQNMRAIGESYNISQWTRERKLMMQKQNLRN
jgi:hypothetical protein